MRCASGGRKCPIARTAVGPSTNCTSPWVGSGSVKKSHPAKNVFPDYKNQVVRHVSPACVAYAKFVDTYVGLHQVEIGLRGVGSRAGCEGTGG